MKFSKRKVDVEFTDEELMAINKVRSILQELREQAFYDDSSFFANGIVYSDAEIENTAEMLCDFLGKCYLE